MHTQHCPPETSRRTAVGILLQTPKNNVAGVSVENISSTGHKLGRASSKGVYLMNEEGTRAVSSQIYLTFSH